ncbi:MAG TPA: protein kinase [Planctomycetota bacterium]|nr:protein kinase [Planctomycetota bacterium]
MSTDAKAAPPPIPKTIGRFSIVRLLGTGCMGSTYLGQDEENLRFAVKVMTAPAAVKKYDWAGKLQTDIEHPNVMKYVELPFDSKYQYLVVTDYLDVVPAGFEPLRSRTFEEIIEIYAKAADALAFLESKGIVHGNVKPSNILCRKTKTEFYPLVADGGLRYKNEASHVKGDVAAAIFPYMAPEHLEAFTKEPKAEQPASAAGDVYSLAVSFVEALTGTTPFKLHVEKPGDPKEELEAKRKKRYRVIFKNDPSTPIDAKKVDDLVSRALGADPTKRPSMKDFALQLRGAIDAAKLAALSK